MTAASTSPATASAGATGPLLRIDALRVEFGSRSDPVTAVAGLDLEVRPGEIVGLVGESGCGKTVTALSVLGLLP
ncbi:MAG TPA: ATP-binding cassette domain-containing protein, partial [Acidimicrobiales bacterium]|nr:ATP-binding cassette domain-containing protein [Acidimicrobiales bacterium]